GRADRAALGALAAQRAGGPRAAAPGDRSSAGAQPPQPPRV
ncbi:MAG: hypothetical protein AVDCRST_MAG79-2140, partial [uncultured Thermoleophilia bacterium]